MAEPGARSSIGKIVLREVAAKDLPLLFEHQQDPESNRMAGTKPRSAESFRDIWDACMRDPSVVSRVILLDGELVGGVSCFKMDGVDAVGYWIARPHWGKGIATGAVRLFLQEVTRRPLYATAARANKASMRVLENCGFRLKGFHMGAETERYIACEVASFVLE